MPNNTLTLKNVKTLDGTLTTITMEGPKNEVLDLEGRITALPSLIDPHVHFRVPGQTYKEDFISGAKAALAGGVTHVFDMPDNEPPINSSERIDKKKALIDEQLREAKIPLRYDLFFGADSKSVEDIPKVQKKIIGINVFMGPSSGGQTLDDDRALARAFQIAAQENLIVAVHAEDYKMISLNQDLYKSHTDVRTHGLIRPREAAIKATERALYLGQEYGTQLYFSHVSTKEEISLIREAKDAQELVWLEITPHHLFLSEDDYDLLGTKGQVNPPLRKQSDHWAMWEALFDGTVDVIGSDHAPHTLQEKSRPYPQSPSGVPGIETRLPLLLDAASKGKLSLGKIVELCRTNIESIFDLPTNQDLVLVDLNLTKTVDESTLKTKCGWSPFAGRTLKGWPEYTILKGEAFKLN